MGLIEIKNLRKEYKVYKNKDKNFFKRLIGSGSQVITAVDNINLTIEKGESVGFIGPNGAGKSTTIKMLTGILVPTSGRIKVNSIEPYKERKRNAWNIGVVFGQKSQLWWDLPAIESLKLLKYIYKIEEDKYQKNLEIFNELLDLKQFVDTPVRQMSLGQRMRADIAASLLHDPEIIYFDEPTIGLDLIAKDKIREFVTFLTEEKKRTIFFTTHDMQDIEKNCHRIIIIDKGKILYDGLIKEVKAKYGKERTLVVEFKKNVDSLEIPDTKIVKKEFKKKWIQFNKDKITAAELIFAIANKNEIHDVSILETEIEHIIKNIYEKGI